MRGSKGLVFSFIFSCLLFSYACTNDEAEEQNECSIFGEVSFSEEVVPVLQTYCYFPGEANSCHVTNGAAPGAYDTYEGVAAAADKINLRVAIDKNMPPDYSDGPTSMLPCDIELLQTWIEEGAQNN